MQLIGAVGLFLLGSCVGLLVALHVQGARRNQLAEHAIESAEQHHEARRAQLETLAQAMLDRLHLVGMALSAEIREASKQRRHDLRLVLGLPHVSVPGEDAPPTRPAVPPPPPVPPKPSALAIARASSPPTTSLVLAADEPTPPSGWTLEQVRTHTETAGEGTRR